MRNGNYNHNCASGLTTINDCNRSLGQTLWPQIWLVYTKYLHRIRILLTSSPACILLFLFLCKIKIHCTKLLWPEKREHTGFEYNKSVIQYQSCEVWLKWLKERRETKCKIKMKINGWKICRDVERLLGWWGRTVFGICVPKKYCIFYAVFIIEIRNFKLILILLSMGSLCEEVAIWVNLLCVIFWVKYCCRASLIDF